MFGTVDREFLKHHPYLLINGDICKFKEIVDTETKEQIALFKCLQSGRVEKVTVFMFTNVMQDEPITAQGKCYELLLEIKRMIEINNLKG